jgi:hypothetical protein
MRDKVGRAVQFIRQDCIKLRGTGLYRFSPACSPARHFRSDSHDMQPPAQDALWGDVKSSKELISILLAKILSPQVFILYFYFLQRYFRKVLPLYVGQASCKCIRDYWHPSGKFVTGCQRVLGTLCKFVVRFQKVLPTL